MPSEKTLRLNATSTDTFDAFYALPESGRGPGIVLVQEIFGVNDAMRATARLFAEEGYVVIVPDLFWRLERNVELGYSDADMPKAYSLFQRLDQALAVKDIDIAVQTLRTHDDCTGDVAVIGFCLGGTLALRAAATLKIDAAAAFYPVAIHELPTETLEAGCPTIVHLGGADKLCPPAALATIQQRFVANANVRVCIYPGAGHAFFNTARPEYDAIASDLALTRTLELLKPLMGPDYDLAALWENHAGLEFFARNADLTIETMTDEPYVNHVPALTGGIGRKHLLHFYKHYFVNVHPADYQLTLVSRTIGVNRLVDETVVSFTHDRMMDYFLPGLAPTGKKIVIPGTAVVTFRGSRIRHEHIYYDYASMLAQAGVIDAKTYSISGAEQAEKVLAPHKHPSNRLMTTWKPPT